MVFKKSNYSSFFPLNWYPHRPASVTVASVPGEGGVPDTGCECEKNPSAYSARLARFMYLVKAGWLPPPGLRLQGIHNTMTLMVSRL
jgi:hypothetical protein